MNIHKMKTHIKSALRSRPFFISPFSTRLQCNILHKSIFCIKKVKVKVAQLCPTLCDPMDYKVHGILQARILEWVAFPFSRRSSQPMDWTQVACIAGRFFTSWASREAQLISGEVPISSTVQWLYNTVENVLNGIWRIHLCNCINICFSGAVLNL